MERESDLKFDNCSNQLIFNFARKAWKRFAS